MIDRKINKYIDFIWEDQLPKEEEVFLKDLIAERKSNNFRHEIDSDYSLYIAYNASKHNYEGYTQCQINALKEILLIYRKQKLDKIPEISKVLKVLNLNGIEPLLLKGAAFICYYAPEIPRMMSDLDIYINSDQFNQALSALYSIGYKYVSDKRHHVTICNGNLEIDVHRCIYKNEGDRNSDIFESLVPVSFLGSNVRVLSPEDMFIHQLVNRGQDICTYQHSKRHLKWIVDCWSVMQRFEPDVESTLKKAKDVNNYYYAAITLSKLVELFPEKFGYNKIENDDNRMRKLLKLATKCIKLGKKYDGDIMHGIKYSCLKLYKELWLNTRIEIVASDMKEPFWKVFLIQRHVLSINDITVNFKRFIRNNKEGANI